MPILALARGYHPWYALGLVPAVVILAGAGLERIQRRLAEARGWPFAFAVTALLLAIVIVFSWHAVAPLYESWNEPAYRAGIALDRLSPHDALVAVVDDGDPTALYYSRRRGWHFLSDVGARPLTSQQAITELIRLRREDAQSLTLLRHTRWWLAHYPEFARHLSMHARVVEDTPDYVIFVLTEER